MPARGKGVGERGVVPLLVVHWGCIYDGRFCVLEPRGASYGAFSHRVSIPIGQCVSKIYLLCVLCEGEETAAAAASVAQALCPETVPLQP